MMAMQTSENSPPTDPGGLNGPRRRTTLKDVARLAGVSVQTVSNALNGTGRLSAGTRERVLGAVGQLGYETHTGAASLRSGRANRLAYPLPTGEPQGENPILPDFLNDLATAAAKRRQQILVLGQGGDDLRALDTVVGSGSVDAVVLSAIVAGDRRVAHLHRTGVPFCCFGRTDPDMPQAWVDIDNRAALHEITGLLLAGGHRTVAFLGYRSQRPWNLEREAGYMDAMRAAGRRPRIVRVADKDVGRDITRLLTGPRRPTAVVTGSDVLAARCYTAARQAGLGIGDDLAVTGFDGSALSWLLSPKLTTVALPLPDIAERIVSRLLGELPNDAGDVLPTRLLIGDSTGAIG